MHVNTHIKQIHDNKKRFLELLLLADEQENMIDKYLEQGEMFVLFEGTQAASVCVVVQLEGTNFELKNMATLPQFQRKGYGKQLFKYLEMHLQDRCTTLYVGTGDVPSTVHFYQACGFSYSHRIANFFTDNYDHPMIEDGVQLVDMVYLKKELPHVTAY